MVEGSAKVELDLLTGALDLTVLAKKCETLRMNKDQQRRNSSYTRERKLTCVSWCCRLSV
jgi:hypothetical protein